MARKKAEPTTIAPATEADESKRDRFLRIGTARMNRVLNSIRLLGNLSSPVYEWTEDDIRAIQDAIVEGLGIAMNKFQKKGAKKVEFTFTHREDA